MTEMIINAVVRGQRLSDKVAQQLAQAIERGELKPGDRLPRERELTERFEVSRMVIREALSQLKSGGLISSKQGLGAFVNAATHRDVFRFHAGKTNYADLRDLFELRMIVETSSARFAALRAGKRDIVAIGRALKEISKSILAGESGVDADFRFHIAIASAGKNAYLEQFIGFLDHRLYEAIGIARVNTKLNFPDLEDLIQKQHEAIFEAIRRKDDREAEKQMKLHLEYTMGQLEHYMRDARGLETAVKP